MKTNLILILVTLCVSSAAQVEIGSVLSEVDKSSFASEAKIHQMRHEHRLAWRDYHTGLIAALSEAASEEDREKIAAQYLEDNLESYLDMVNKGRALMLEQQRTRPLSDATAVIEKEYSILEDIKKAKTREERYRLLLTLRVMRKLEVGNE